jgi:4-oxalocrotonate tautomerase
MPIVTIKLMEGVFDKQTQEAMIDAVTDALCAVGGEGMRPAMNVLVEEVADGRWSVGGQTLRTQEILARRKQRGEEP